ncbi:hypothetical protein GALMADRAFT_585958 [Galerina marginata CBS 339.88]|uniref:Uncharacterized protein n=1 Tax=Galerina marginata (strain CBS 339.88) TaxID=685588 RepID=A0A067SU77_GALM3|nr:hypothetical protein GALMADRAFT_585958 [Galerina marginata CBS 339.88]
MLVIKASCVPFSLCIGSGRGAEGHACAEGLKHRGQRLDDGNFAAALWIIFSATPRLAEVSAPTESFREIRLTHCPPCTALAIGLSNRPGQASQKLCNAVGRCLGRLSKTYRSKARTPRKSQTMNPTMSSLFFSPRSHEVS